MIIKTFNNFSQSKRKDQKKHHINKSEEEELEEQ